MRALSRRRQELHRQLEWLALLLSTTLAILPSPTAEDLSAAEPRRSIGTVRSSSKHRSAACLKRPGWATRSKRLLSKPDNLIRYRQQASAWSAAGSKSRAP